MNTHTKRPKSAVVHNFASGDLEILHEAKLLNSEWDGFLTQLSGAPHTQLSLWAGARAYLGWESRRIVAVRGGSIVGGVQLLLRRLPIVGTICYAPQGPVVAQKDPELMGLLVQQARRVARAEHSRLLVIQPPAVELDWTGLLVGEGFRKSAIGLGPTATVVIDLANEQENILAAMKARARRNIRIGQKKGLQYRPGGQEDLATFHAILKATSKRQGFSIFPLAFYRELWRLFAPGDNIRLSLVNYESEIVSAQLDILFGDTITNNMSVWNGSHKQRRPNDFLQWSVIKAGKEAGYRYYDQEGIEPAVAQAILADQPVPAEYHNSVSTFKLGFGGRVRLKPAAYDYFYSPFMRAMWNYSIPLFARSSWFGSLLNRIRTNSKFRGRVWRGDDNTDGLT